MQMQIPIFPENTKLINPTLGVCQMDDMVYYLHNGSPIFCHYVKDMKSYRYILGNLVEIKLCKCSELSKALGVPVRQVQRYAKTLREKGNDWFFNDRPRAGNDSKLKGDPLEKAQQWLDEFVSVNEIARRLGVTNGAIRYYIRNGRLKKKKSR